MVRKKRGERQEKEWIRVKFFFQALSKFTHQLRLGKKRQSIHLFLRRKMRLYTSRYSCLGTLKLRRRGEGGKIRNRPFEPMNTCFEWFKKVPYSNTKKAEDKKEEKDCRKVSACPLNLFSLCTHITPTQVSIIAVPSPSSREEAAARKSLYKIYLVHRPRAANFSSELLKLAGIASRDIK